MLEMSAMLGFSSGGWEGGNLTVIDKLISRQIFMFQFPTDAVP